MFPADIIPSTYCEARKEAEAHRAHLARKSAAAAAANNNNNNNHNQKDGLKLAQPSPQRPAGPARTFSSAFFGLFPAAPNSAYMSATNSQASSTTNSPSATPMPSPSLNGPKQSWFAPRPIPKATDMDIACLPPAWS